MAWLDGYKSFREDQKEVKEVIAEIKPIQIKVIDQKDIPRLKPPQTLSAETTEILKKAKKQFGYNPPTGLKPLASLLTRLDIEILDEAAVNLYKENLAKKLNSSLRERGDRYYQWYRTDIQNFREEIPIYVLNKALQIKEKSPELNVAFSVDYLAQSSKSADPFLMVSYEREGYYIEVWGESGFEK